MKKLILFIMVVLGLAISSFYLFSIKKNTPIPPQTKISFWDQSKKGTNIFNKTVYREDIKAAKDYGITFIRLAPDKFPSVKRDFLIGDADCYRALVPEDLAALKKVLDMCAEEKMPVVLTMLSLPGSRWRQNNNGKDDLRVWISPEFQQQAMKFWQDLALELKDHPAIVGYNILNEPHLERLYDTTSIDIHHINQREVQAQLFKFYRLIIEAIKKVDLKTPIILDSSSYGSPQTFKLLKSYKDNNILYSFHMYEPYAYTNYKINQGRFSYPGRIKNQYWDKNALKAYMEAVDDFQKHHNIPSNRILVGEFGADRRSKGLPQYFQDLIDIFTASKWHFSFYAFREDGWDKMDYELGNTKLLCTYWQAIEKGDKPLLNRKSDYPQFRVLKEALAKPSSKSRK